MRNVYRRTWQESGLRLLFPAVSPFGCVDLQHIHTQRAFKSMENRGKVKDLYVNERKDLSYPKDFSEDELLAETIERLSKERHDSRSRRKLSISSKKLSLIKESTGHSHSSCRSITSFPLKDLSSVPPEQGISSFKDPILPQPVPSCWSTCEPSHLPASATSSVSASLDVSFSLKEMERMLFTATKPNQDADELRKAIGGKNKVHHALSALPALEDIKTKILMPIKIEKEDLTQDVGDFFARQERALSKLLQPQNKNTYSTEESSQRLKDAQEVFTSLAQPGGPPQSHPARTTCTHDDTVRDASSQTADNARLADSVRPLLSVSSDPTSGIYTIAPEAPIPTLWDALSSLSQALTQVKSSFLSKGGGDKTSIQIHLHLVRKIVNGDGTPGTLLSLNPVYSELGASALHRLDVSSRKEELLERIMNAAKNGMHITAIVEPEAVVLGFAAELFFCCEEVTFTGQKDSVRVGFPELMYGAFPSPVVIPVVAECLKDNARLGLSSTVLAAGFLHDASPLSSGVSAPHGVSIDSIAAFLLLLHTKPFSHWEVAVLHGWRDNIRRSKMIPSSVTSQWWRLLSYHIRLVSRAFFSFHRRLHLGTTLRPSLPRLMMSVDVRHSIRLQWQCYCCAVLDYAKYKTSTRSADCELREIAMACFNSTAAYNSSKLYQHAMKNLLQKQATELFVLETDFVYLDDQSLPTPEFAEAVADQILAERKHQRANSTGALPITVVLDSTVAPEAQIKLTALLCTSSSPVRNPSASETNCSYAIVFVGSPAELHDRISLVPSAVVVNTFGQTIAALTESRRSRLDSVVELSLTGLQLTVEDRSSMNNDFDIQKAAITFLRSRNIPFVLTSSGEEGLKVVVALALELYRTATHECLLSNAALRLLLSQLSVYMGLRKRVPVILAQFGVDAIYNVIWRYPRFYTVYEGLNITKEKFTRFLHTCVAAGSFSNADEFYSPFAPSMARSRDLPNKLAERVLLALIDYCCVVLSQKEVCAAQDLNLLSISTLWLHPETGGILSLAEHHFGPPKLMAKRMEDEAQLLKRSYESLSLLKWMGECGLIFDALGTRSLKEVNSDPVP